MEIINVDHKLYHVWQGDVVDVVSLDQAEKIQTQSDYGTDRVIVDAEDGDTALLLAEMYSLEYIDLDQDGKLSSNQTFGERYEQ
jgi:hypothetical protein